MKKVITIVLSFVFLFSSVGITYSIHTCQMFHTSQFSLQHKKSCCGNTETPSGCCENETHTIKITDFYIQTVFYQLSSPAPYGFDLLAAVIDGDVFIAEISTLDLPLNQYSPPRFMGVGYHILFRSMLIWYLLFL